ncbi:MAG: hypothetical protein Q8P57_02480 [Candidatus Pacearchaeota archaeon]|nr:hypothetical protein [Candidatus Pacearchaeota archaeon]
MLTRDDLNNESLVTRIFEPPNRKSEVALEIGNRYLCLTSLGNIQSLHSVQYGFEKLPTTLLLFTLPERESVRGIVINPFPISGSTPLTRLKIMDARETEKLYRKVLEYLTPQEFHHQIPLEYLTTWSISSNLLPLL